MPYNHQYQLLLQLLEDEMKSMGDNLGGITGNPGKGNDKIFDILKEKEKTKQFDLKAKADMVTAMYSSLSDCIQSYSNYFQAKEKTSQIKIECDTRVIESNNKLKETIIKEKMKSDEMKAKFIIELAKVDNERESILITAQAVECILDEIKYLRKNVEQSKDEKGFFDSNTTNFLEHLNKLNIELVKQLPALRG